MSILACSTMVAAPPLTLKPIDEAGYNALLKQHAGKIIVMDIWAAWCEPCRMEMPDLVQMSKRLAPKGVDLVTVTIDNPAELSYAEKFLHKNNVPFPSYYRKTKDEDAWVHNVHPQWTGTLPAMFIYDKSGKLATAMIGSQPIAKIEATIAELQKR